MKLEIADAAREAVRDAASWYEARSPGRGDAFAVAVLAAFAAIVERPEAWASWIAGEGDAPPIRRYVMAQYPFTIAYQAFADRVVVMAVAHASRRPGYWR